MLFMHVHLNYCLLHFAGSGFRIEFKCTWCFTNPKILQAFIRIKIPHDNVLMKVDSYLIIWILRMSDLSTIFPCTPLRCQNKREELNENNLERNHIKNGWNNHLFNSHYILSHKFKSSLIPLVLHMLGMDAMM